jgi:hypothetical protein
MGLNAVKTQRMHTASICSQFRLALRQKIVSFDAIAKLIVYINATSTCECMLCAGFVAE